MKMARSMSGFGHCFFWSENRISKVCTPEYQVYRVPVFIECSYMQFHNLIGSEFILQIVPGSTFFFWLHACKYKLVHMGEHLPGRKPCVAGWRSFYHTFNGYLAGWGESKGKPKPHHPFRKIFSGFSQVELSLKMTESE
jgi:hypothetical protein